MALYCVIGRSLTVIQAVHEIPKSGVHIRLICMPPIDSYNNMSEISEMNKRRAVAPKTRSKQHLKKIQLQTRIPLYNN